MCFEKKKTLWLLKKRESKIKIIKSIKNDIEWTLKK